MTDAVETIKAIGAIVTPIAVAYIVYLQIKANAGQKELKKNVDGKMDALLQASKSASHAEGKLEGKQESRQEKKEDDEK